MDHETKTEKRPDVVLVNKFKRRVTVTADHWDKIQQSEGHGFVIAPPEKSTPRPVIKETPKA